MIEGAYYDFYLAAVETATKDGKYLGYVRFEGGYFHGLGAIGVLDCWENEIAQGDISFANAVKLKPGEQVACNLMQWESKESHAKGMKQAYADFDAGDFDDVVMGYDGKRLTPGTFRSVTSGGDEHLSIASTSSYLRDFYVAPVRNVNEDAFVQESNEIAAAFRGVGAVQAVDCWGTEVPDGKLTSLPMAVGLREDETVVLGWIAWESGEVRQQGMAEMRQFFMNRSKTAQEIVETSRMMRGSFNPVSYVGLDADSA